MAQSPEYPDLKWMPPRAWTNANRDAVQLIVIHTTEGSAHGQSSEDGASYDQRRTDGTSAHYFVDSNSVVQCVRTADQAHTARAQGNRRGIHYELCGRAGTQDWGSEYSQNMLARAAAQAARDARKWGIPVRHLTVAQVAAGAKGFCGHADITHAFPQDNGSHTDPGKNFPWSQFLDMVRAELAGKSAAEEQDMPTVKEILEAPVKVGDEDWYLGTAIGYAARKSYEAVRDLGAFVSGEVARDAQTAAMLAGMNKALSAIAAANSVLTAEQVAALTDQVRQAATAAGAAATALVEAKIESLRQHLGDTADA